MRWRRQAWAWQRSKQASEWEGERTGCFQRTCFSKHHIVDNVSSAHSSCTCGVDTGCSSSAERFVNDIPSHRIPQSSRKGDRGYVSRLRRSPQHYYSSFSGHSFWSLNQQGSWTQGQEELGSNSKFGYGWMQCKKRIEKHNLSTSLSSNIARKVSIYVADAELLRTLVKRNDCQQRPSLACALQTRS